MSKLIECGFQTAPFLTNVKSAESFTSTSANTLAEWCKLMYEKFEDALEKANAVSESHCLIGSDRPLQGRKGKTAEEIRSMFLEGSENIIYLKAFAAWMREGIKAKERLRPLIDAYQSEELKEAEQAYRSLTIPQSEYEHLRALQKELEELENSVALLEAETNCELVKSAQTLSEDKVKSELGVKLMFDLLFSEAAASVYGKSIHKGGHLKRIKEDIMTASMNPIVLNGMGASTVAVTKSPSMEVSDVEALEMKLQGLHREHQTKFNSIMKTEVTDKVLAFNMAELDRYEKERTVAAEHLKEVREPIDEKKAQLRAAIRDEERRLRELSRKLRTDAEQRLKIAKGQNEGIKAQLHAEARELRIVLPHDLKKVYEQIKLASQQA